jgi:glycosyltransferase involved in cell wall biosynthesis
MYIEINPSERRDKIPLLSILIPAFQYADGVVRILRGLNVNDAEYCEVIVFDDSLNEEVALAVDRCKKSKCIPFFYKHNSPPLGAVANWNALLDAARGQYCLLMHHDEFPIEDSFIQDLLSGLREQPDVDVLMLSCLQVNASSGWNRYHLPQWLRALVVKHFRHYLFRRNVIGPTAALVVRRAIYPRFDERLQWLVDVDVYVRTLELSQSTLLFSNIKIGSIMNRADSITAQLGSFKPRIAKEERTYLGNVRGTKCFWLGSYPQYLPAFHWLLWVGETVCWTFMRVVTRSTARLSPCPVRLSVVRRALLGRIGF